MVLVQLVYQARSGKANELVAGFRQSLAVMRRTVAPELRVRILTDLSGPFDTVVQEIEVTSLAEWERLRTLIFSHPEVQAAEAALPDIIESGRMTYYTIEATD